MIPPAYNSAEEALKAKIGQLKAYIFLGTVLSFTAGFVMCGILISVGVITV